MNTVDYSRYTDDELEDVKEHIDAEKYPHNYKALILEIKKREENPEKHEEPTYEIPPDFFSIKKNGIEPFRYGANALIGNKEQAIRIIKANCYYFYVVGAFAIILGSFVYLQNTGDISTQVFGVYTALVGIFCIFTALFTSIFKSRISTVLLVSFVIYSIGEAIYVNGLDGFNVIKVILLLAAFRITKAIFYYNK